MDRDQIATTEARTLVDVGAVRLLPGLGALLLLARRGSLLAGLLLLGGRLASWCLTGGSGGLQRKKKISFARGANCNRAKVPSELPWVPFRRGF